VLESVQGVHAFTGTASTLFTPAFATSLWLFSIQKLLPKILHVSTGLYACETGCVQIKLGALIIHDLFLGQATWSHSANWTGF
jgi:hypothetical protein